MACCPRLTDGELAGLMGDPRGERQAGGGLERPLLTLVCPTAASGTHGANGTGRCRHRIAYMKDGLSASAADRQDIAQAEAIMERLRRGLDNWHEASDERAGRIEEPLDVGRLHSQARELANMLGRVRRRHATRREARERRGSVLEG